MTKCPYNQNLCSKQDSINHRHICNDFTYCHIYQEITTHLVELMESGKLEEIMQDEYDLGALL